MSISISAFYCFAPISESFALKLTLADLCVSHGARGIILLAQEGINATIGCPRANMANLMAAIERATSLTLKPKLSYASILPFKELKVRVKKEIVTIGDLSIDPLCHVGTYVGPAEWNALISDPDVLLIDTRNSFEHVQGTFKGALDPGTVDFKDFPAFVQEKLRHKKSHKIAMFCTGGIRCEKATSLLVRDGFAQVYHLEGGILKYLEEVPQAESLWQGDCFVFDERIALAHGLAIAPAHITKVTDKEPKS